MKIREIKKRSGWATVSAWSPMWASSYGRGDRFATGDEGVLTDVERRGDRLVLTMRYENRDHLGSLEWDPPPAVPDVEMVLHAHLGDEIRTIAELDV